MNYRVSERYQDATGLLKGLVTASPTSDAAIYAASELLQVYRSTTDDDILNFTRSNLVQKRSSDPIAQLILAKMLSVKPDKMEAVTLLNSIAAGNPGTEVEKLALLDLFHIYYASPQYASSLGTPLASLMKNHAEDANVKEALWLSSISQANTLKPQTEPAKQANQLLSNELTLENYPNPFNPSTIIRYRLADEGMVSLKVLDILGREVTTLAAEYKTAGMHEVRFNASSISSGIYFYKLEAGGKSAIQKMVLVK